MAQTTAEIRNQAAQKLGLLGTGQTLRSEQSGDLDQAYLEVYGTLQTLGLANWGISTSAVPNELVEPIVSMTAAIRATRYAVPTERFQRIMLDYHGGQGLPSAVDRIRALVSAPRWGQPRIQNF